MDEGITNALKKGSKEWGRSKIMIVGEGRAGTACDVFYCNDIVLLLLLLFIACFIVLYEHVSCLLQARLPSLTASSAKISQRRVQPSGYIN